MTYQELFCTALRLVSEVPEVGENADYEDRSAYLLPIFVSRYAPLDRAYRDANGMGAQTVSYEPRQDLSLEFPLSEVFASPAASFLASALVMEENPELSDRLRLLSEELIAAIRALIPCRSERIVNQYP